MLAYHPTAFGNYFYFSRVQLREYARAVQNCRSGPPFGACLSKSAWERETYPQGLWRTVGYSHSRIHNLLCAEAVSHSRKGAGSVMPVTPARVSGQVLALWHGEYRPSAVSSVKLERGASDVPNISSFQRGQSYLAHALLPKHWTSTLNTSIVNRPEAGRPVVA